MPDDLGEQVKVQALFKSRGPALMELLLIELGLKGQPLALAFGDGVQELPGEIQILEDAMQVSSRDISMINPFRFLLGLVSPLKDLEKGRVRLAGLGLTHMDFIAADRSPRGSMKGPYLVSGFFLVERGLEL